MTQSTPTKDRIQVIAICGSIRPGSYTRLALEVALRGASQMNVDTRLLDLRDYQLVFCDGNKNEASYPDDVFRLRRDVKSAEGIILGTPEYHSSFSGVLKNALDLMGFDEFEGKMVGLVGVSGGDMGAVNALNSLRPVLRALHAWSVPSQVFIPNAWKAFDENGAMTSPKLENRLLEVGRQVARFAFLHSSAQSQEFLKAWEAAPTNPGGIK